MEEETRIIAFRSIRELLTNVTKHAQAKKVRVKLEQQGDKLYILISDDGIGFDYNPEIIRLNKMSGFGLFSIQERMQDIGGSMKINSSKGMGSKVLLTIPLQHQT